MIACYWADTCNEDFVFYVHTSLHNRLHAAPLSSLGLNPPLSSTRPFHQLLTHRYFIPMKSTLCQNDNFQRTSRSTITAYPNSFDTHPERTKHLWEQVMGP